MDYVLLIAVDPSAYAGLTQSEQEAIFAEYFAYTESLRAKGIYVEGNPLQGVETATTVQVRDHIHTHHQQTISPSQRRVLLLFS